ncbi:hypothetical protein DW865_04045 [Mediterraneibacter gnavus]|nr:hypothetical protein DW865_04045 [Mediterraneibacter gnavus]
MWSFGGYLLDIVRLIKYELKERIEIAYQTKIVDYKYKKKVVNYNLPIQTGGCNQMTRKSYKEMSGEEKKNSDERRIKYYKKISSELIEVALMNPFKIMVTLTFKEDIQTYKIAINRWRNFMRRMKWKYGEVSYICVWERTKKDRIHFHALLDLNIKFDVLNDLWGYGYVWVSKIENGEGKLKSILYMTKYMVKSIQERIQSGESVRGERFFFCSKNLDKPKIEKLEERLSIQDLIFENMENIIRDGVYEIKDFNGKVINRMEFVEYKTTNRGDNN